MKTEPDSRRASQPRRRVGLDDGESARRRRVVSRARRERRASRAASARRPREAGVGSERVSSRPTARAGRARRERRGDAPGASQKAAPRSIRSDLRPLVPEGRRGASGSHLLSSAGATPRSRIEPPAATTASTRPARGCRPRGRGRTRRRRRRSTIGSTASPRPAGGATRLIAPLRFDRRRAGLRQRSRSTHRRRPTRARPARSTASAARDAAATPTPVRPRIRVLGRNLLRSASVEVADGRREKAAEEPDVGFFVKHSWPPG